jgi:hypothetical protein
MKTRFLQFAPLALLSGAAAFGEVFRPTVLAPPSGAVVENQSTANANPTASVPTSASVPETRFTEQQLDQLLGPIALYPDALIALILPSATVTSDVVLAARYLAEEGNRVEGIESQSWDDSVKALAHYPDVVKWMDQNLAWTKQLGEAFIQQPAEVMKAVQRLRAVARAAGTLVDTPQQQVIVEAETIAIVPAQPDVIYVPYYDPDVVYVTRRSYYPASFFSFSIGYPVGHWLGYHVDWRHCRLWTIDYRARHNYWHSQRDWRRPSFSFGVSWHQNDICRPWSPGPGYRRSSHRAVTHARYSAEIVRPSRGRAESWSHSSRGNTVGRADRVHENRVGAPSRSYQRSTSSRTDRFEPAVVAPTVQAPIVSIPPQQENTRRNWSERSTNPRSTEQRPTDRRVTDQRSRDSRATDQRSNDQRSNNHPDRVDSRRSGNRESPGARAITVAPAQSVQPSAPDRAPAAVSRGHRQHQPAPAVAAAPSNSGDSRDSRSSRGGDRSDRGNRGGGGGHSSSSSHGGWRR